MTTLNGRVCDQHRADREGQERHGGERKSRAHRMGERERHQREADTHHFRRAAARAQIVKRDDRTSAEMRRETCRPGPAIDGPQQRRMERDQQRGDRRPRLRTSRLCGKRETTAAMSASSPAATKAGAGVSAGASHATSVRREEWQCRIGRDDAADRHLAVGGGAGAGPKPQRVVGDEPLRTAKAASARITTKTNERDGAAAARQRRASWRASGSRARFAPPHAATGRAGSFPRRTDRG